MTVVLLASADAVESEPRFPSPLDLAFAPVGGTLAAGDAGTKSVNFIDPTSRKILRTVQLQAPPAGLAWSADGAHLYVAESGAGRIAELSAADGKINRRFDTSRYPRGLALVPDRQFLLAADWGLNQLCVIDLQSGDTVARVPVGCQPTSVAVSPDESLAVVSNLIPAGAATAPGHATEITIIDLETLVTRPPVRLPTGSTNTRGIVINSDGKSACVVHTLGRFHLPTTQLDRGWVNTNALSIIDLETATRSATVLLDQVMDGAADPWGVAVSPDGARLYVTLAGVHQLAVIDLGRLMAMIGSDPDAFTNDLAALYRGGLIRRIDLPAEGPRGITIAPDGRSLAVAGHFSGNVVLLDADGANPQSIALGSQPEPDLARRGEIAFHDAGPCFQRWLSCSSCHPDARADGLNWDLLNDGIGNPKNARSMLLSHRTPPMMSLGIRDTPETCIRAGFVNIQFTKPDPRKVEAVIAYFKSLEPITSPHRNPDGSLTEAAARGEKIFRRKDVGCTDCHSGPLFTDLTMSDVGTATGRDRGATAYDTPTLVEVWRTPPYLHDGRAATLREVLIDHNPDDDHGTTNTLKPAEIDDLIQYLLSL